MRITTRSIRGPEIPVSDGAVRIVSRLDAISIGGRAFVSSHRPVAAVFERGGTTTVSRIPDVALLVRVGVALLLITILRRRR